MKHLYVIVVISASFVSPILSAADVSSESPTVHSLTTSPPIGKFGNRLGTKTVIAGELDDRVLIANPLRVSEVEGQGLKKVITIEVVGLKLQPGVRYRLEGYESGAFTGTPNWVSEKAQQPFHFESTFVVTKQLGPTTAQRPATKTILVPGVVFSSKGDFVDVRLRLPMKSEQVSLIYPGQKASTTYKGKKYDAVITSLEPDPDEYSYFHAKLNDPDYVLLPKTELTFEIVISEDEK